MRRYQQLLSVVLFLAVLFAVFEISGLRDHFSLEFLRQRLIEHELSGLLIFVLAAAQASLDPDIVWSRLPGRTRGPYQAGEPTLSCPVCELVVPVTSPHRRLGRQCCPRCGEILHRRKPRSLQRTTALILAAPFVFNFLVFGSTLPQTVAAKLGQGRSGFWGNANILNLGLLSEWTVDGSTVAAVFLLAMAALGVFLLRRAWQSFAALLFLGLLLAFYVAVNMPNYFWCHPPATPGQRGD